MATPEVSHGRGGAGNINSDDTPYVDGEVVRVGPEGSHGDGAFSTGRGGMPYFLSATQDAEMRPSSPLSSRHFHPNTQTPSPDTFPG